MPGLGPDTMGNEEWERLMEVLEVKDNAGPDKILSGRVVKKTKFITKL